MNEYIFSEITIFPNKKPVKVYTVLHSSEFNMWLNRKQVHSHICFCIQLIVTPTLWHLQKTLCTQEKSE